MSRRFVSIALRVSVSLLLILILLYITRDKYAQIGQAIKGMDPLLFLAGLLVYVTAAMVASYRLKIIADSQEKIRLKFAETANLTFIGYFFNNFLPTAIGGDVVKAYYISKGTSDKMASYTTVFVDRFIGLVTMILMAFVALFFVQGRVIDSGVRNKIYVITAMAVAMMLLLISKNFAKKFSFLLGVMRPLEEKLRGIYNAIYHYRNHRALMLRSFAISIISQMLFFVSIAVLAASLSSHIAMSDIFLRIPIISMMSLLPSLNGFGPREFSTKLLFGPLIGDVSAVAVSILWDLVLFMLSIAGGIIYAVNPRYKMDIKKAQSR